MKSLSCGDGDHTPQGRGVSGKPRVRANERALDVSGLMLKEETYHFLIVPLHHKWVLMVFTGCPMQVVDAISITVKLLLVGEEFLDSIRGRGPNVRAPVVHLLLHLM